MHFKVIQQILGLLLTVFSLSMLPPLFLSLAADDGAMTAFLGAFFLILTVGLLLWLPVRAHREELRLRDGFLVVILFWVGLSLSGAVPLMITERPHLSWVDAVFESVSALTTTGATILTGIDHMPVSVQFYRQLLQWLGGMGIIVLAVAILPMLGIGGMQLYRAETPGPIKDTKLTPRITETAKTLWYLYLGLTMSCAVCYWLAGMSWFDAICHSFSTVSIGGFSTHDASINYFPNPAVKYVATFFMFLAGINFSLHFLAWRRLSPRPYIGDSECRAYMRILGALCVFCVLYSWAISPPQEWTVTDTVFQAVSIATTTGFVSTGYSSMPGVLPILLLLSCFIGACAGSTGGGLKVIRITLLYKQGVREIKRLVHPNGVFLIKLGGKPVPERVIEAVWGYLAVFVTIFLMLGLALMATGLDLLTSFSAAAACINNLGPGLGEVSQHYGNLGSAAKLILSFAMLLGRLEIFTLLVILSPIFWRP